mgnify:CR=1 FL=1
MEELKSQSTPLKTFTSFKERLENMMNDLKDCVYDFQDLSNTEHTTTQEDVNKLSK